jgi:hypothetical protein
VIRAARAAPRGASSHDIGFGAPKELISFIQGAIELRPSIFRHGLMALLASRLRSTGIPRTILISVPQLGASGRAGSARVGTVLGVGEGAIELTRGALPDAHPVFIHRDYHPTNVPEARGRGERRR